MFASSTSNRYRRSRREHRNLPHVSTERWKAETSSSTPPSPTTESHQMARSTSSSPPSTPPATDSLQCCVLTEGDKLYTTQASVFYKFYIEDVLSPVLELFKNAPTKAKQYACVLPQLGFQASHVTLSSSSSCPMVLEEYLPVLRARGCPWGVGSLC